MLTMENFRWNIFEKYVAFYFVTLAVIEATDQHRKLLVLTSAILLFQISSVTAGAQSAPPHAPATVVSELQSPSAVSLQQLLRVL